MARKPKSVWVECEHPPGKAVREGKAIRIMVRQRRRGWITIRLNFEAGTFDIGCYSSKRAMQDAQEFTNLGSTLEEWTRRLV